MYKVIAQFKDKLNLQHFYNAGDEFDSVDKNRISDLLIRGLIVEVEKTKVVKEVKASKSKVKVAD